MIQHQSTRPGSPVFFHGNRQVKVIPEGGGAPPNLLCFTDIQNSRVSLGKICTDIFEDTETLPWDVGWSVFFCFDFFFVYL